MLIPWGRGSDSAKLNLLDDLSGGGIVFEERIQIRIRTPQIFAFPADPMGAISCGRKLLFDDPGFRVHTINHARRRNSHPELAVTPFLSVRAGAERIGRCLRGLGRLRLAGCAGGLASGLLRAGGSHVVL